MTILYLNVYNFDFVVEYLHLKATVHDEVDHPGKDPIGMSLVIADAADTYGRQLPGIVIANLGDGNIELVANPARDRLKNLPFTFKGHIFRQAEADLGYTDIHITVENFGVTLEKRYYL